MKVCVRTCEPRTICARASPELCARVRAPNCVRACEPRTMCARASPELCVCVRAPNYVRACEPQTGSTTLVSTPMDRTALYLFFSLFFFFSLSLPLSFSPWAILPKHSASGGGGICTPFKKISFEGAWSEKGLKILHFISKC